ncbi:13403_t:CDS:2, partial [Dentiscutata heterogama]
DANQYLIKTGAFINDIKISKKGWILPGQRSQFFDITPVNYTLQLQAMTAEKLEFNLPAVFTIGPKDDAVSLEKYAKLLSSKDKNSEHVKDLVRGIIEGETRAIAAAMTMEEIFQERKGFKDKVIKNVQAELEQQLVRIFLQIPRLDEWDFFLSAFFWKLSAYFGSECP